MSHNIYIALGSNLGERLENLHAAVRALPPDIEVIRLSSVYETNPWGYVEQPDFLNQVIQAETELSPMELITYLKAIEKRIGRGATFQYGPRVIDMDILFYDNLMLESRDLHIPHPRLAERAFVLVPLLELEPEKVHPALGSTIRELLSKVDVNDVRIYQPSNIPESD